ncbi:MAG: hypothetical protein GY906_23320 [bacterium]|nr:hypothetical protein [bacterium]
MGESRSGRSSGRQELQTGRFTGDASAIINATPTGNSGATIERRESGQDSRARRGRNIGRAARLAASLTGAGLVMAPISALEAAGVKGVNDFSNIEGKRESGQNRGGTSRNSPARNRLAASGPDRAGTPREASTSTAAPRQANARRTRLQSARPRRTGLRIDFSERSKRSQSGLGVAGA